MTSREPGQPINNAIPEGDDFRDRIIRVAGVGGWEVDVATGGVMWSAETFHIHGLPLNYQPTLEDGINFFNPEARPVLRAAIQRGTAEGQGWDLELPFVRANGQSIWVRSMGTVTFSDGKPLRLTGTFQDITARVNERLALQKANDRVTLATNSGRIGIWEWDIQQDVMHWDAWMYRLYGTEPRDDVSAYDLWQRQLHPEDRARTWRAVRIALKQGTLCDTEFRIVWGDESVHYIRGTGQVTRDDAGQAQMMIGTIWDVTEAKRLSIDLAQQHQLLRVTLNSIGDGVITADAENHVTWLNPVAEHMTGWTVADAGGHPLPQVFQIVHAEGREPKLKSFAQPLEPDIAFQLANDTILISRDGSEFGIEDSLSPIRDGDGNVLGTVLVFHDVTMQRRLAREMIYRASHDALTGLINRNEFELRLEEVLRLSRTERSEHAVLYIDLDQFKIVNDTAGHGAGDKLLQAVATLFADVVRAADTVARLGGDEFAILLRHCSMDRATLLAQTICDRMEEFRFIHEGTRFRIGTSIGLVPVDERWISIATIVQAGDSSCYAAKEAGRNRVHIWHDTDEAMQFRLNQTQWATRLEQALDDDRFELFFQRIEPLDAVQSGTHVEILLRMRETDGSLIAPGVFLPAAERFHLASRVDRWVVSNVLRWMIETDIGFLEILCLNLSGQSVSDRAFHLWMKEVLSDAGPQICRKLCLEITETSAVTNLTDAALFVAQVRDAGVRVALDDFGAGASSFGYLKTMQVDFLKIDGQFIRNLLTDPLDAAAVRCFVDVAQVVGVRTIAEFVDSLGVLTKLKEIGVNFAQGYLMHRPEPIVGLLKG